MFNCHSGITNMCTYAVADPAMGGPGGSPHRPKIRADHGDAKHSASDAGEIFHLNPQLLATFLYENGQKTFSFTACSRPAGVLCIIIIIIILFI